MKKGVPLEKVMKKGKKMDKDEKNEYMFESKAFVLEQNGNFERGGKQKGSKAFTNERICTSPARDYA